MSLMHVCPDCESKYETGLGGSGGPCRDCEARHGRLADGGLPLSPRERVAVADFVGLVVPKSGLPHTVDDSASTLVFGDGQCTDMATVDGERAALTPVEVAP